MGCDIMKALIRKHGSTPTSKLQDEIFPETSWPDWVKADGWPLTEENYGYALCDECPEDIEDLTVSDFMVTSETLTEKDEHGELYERKRWTAVYKGQENISSSDKMKEIEKLKRELAALESDL